MSNAPKLPTVPIPPIRDPGTVPPIVYPTTKGA